MKFTFACFAFVAALAASAPVMAEDNKAPQLDLTKQTVETFDVQADKVRTDMEKGGRFEYISSDDREIVENGLKFMHELIAKNGSVAAMSEDDKIALLNRQERVNALLTKNDSQRIICEKSIQTGTMFKSTMCHTVAELEKRKRESDGMLERTRLNQTSFKGMGGPAPH